jgi:succinyl-CoA synthetase alpha subunit
MAAADYIASAIEKPAIIYMAGLHAPLERSFGDAATIITTHLSHAVPAINTDKQTLAAFKQAKVSIAKRPAEIPKLLKKVLA